jgi:hypothetical protein
MPTRPIKIMAGNTADGSLQLSDRGHTVAEGGDTILWQIANKSGVASITAIEEKADSTNIFSEPPHKKGNNWVGVVDPEAPPKAEYVYSIVWMAGDGSGPYTFDPKITIKPAAGLVRERLASGLLAFLAFPYWVYRRRQRNSR